MSTTSGGGSRVKAEELLGSVLRSSSSPLNGNARGSKEEAMASQRQRQTLYLSQNGPIIYRYYYMGTVSARTAKPWFNGLLVPKQFNGLG